MARELGTGATTAYAAQRYAPRPSRGPVGQNMSAKQREFLSDLVIETQKLTGARIRAKLAEALPKGMTAKDAEEFAAEVDSPRAIVTEIQAQLNRTNTDPRNLINEWITARDNGRRNAPRAQAAAPAASSGEIIDGEAYRSGDGRVFRAYTTQAGRLCLKLWDAEAKEFGWFGGARGRNVPADLVQLSIEESREFGRATGTCIRCMRHLTDDNSVREGIGPICASKL